MYRDDYKKGGFRMLSIIDSTGELTSFQMLVNASFLLMASLSPFFLKQAGSVYLFSVIGLNVLFIGTIAFFFQERSARNARKVFIGSVIYFPILWVVMVLDRLTLG